jgi:hypothetical protein
MLKLMWESFLGFRGCFIRPVCDREKTHRSDCVHGGTKARKECLYGYFFRGFFILIERSELIWHGFI